MGWNTWNTFGANINEQLILETTDKMIELGLRDAGYEYVVIDDIWSLKERDADGNIVPDPEKFPHGMKFIGDYIHSKGLKFGMYSCAGYQTCAGFPASYEYEWQDAKLFASWGVDFLKYDYCYHPMNEKPDMLYKRMSLALANSGRDIVFSACSWGADNTKQWIKETGAHMWRSTGDIGNGWASIRSIAQSQLEAMEYNGRGCYDDLDMLVVGMSRGNVDMGGGTFEEYKTHFSFWSMLSSPLIIGCDIRDMSDEAKRILLNKEIIAIDQDEAACTPFFVAPFYNFVPREARKPEEPYFENYPKGLVTLARILANGDIALGFFNFDDDGHGSWITMDGLGLPITSGKTIEAYDLWDKDAAPIRPVNGVFNCPWINPHACRMYRLKIVDAK